MANPPPLAGVTGEFDLIWSESAIYNIGRANAFAGWFPLLNPDGWLVFSDIVWQCEPSARSDKASAFWVEEYPDITTAADIVGELTAAGFEPLYPVTSNKKAWSNYYDPLRERLRALATRRDNTQALSDLMAELRREIEIYDCTGDEVALYYFLARRHSTSE